MRVRRSWVALAGALALCACSKKAEAPDTAPSSSAPAPAVTPAATPAPVESEPTPTPTPSPTATIVVGEIPAAITGRWGMVPKDCTSTLGDAKGLLVISPKQLKFYEAVAKLGAVKEQTADSIRATYAFSGEGQSWTLDVALAVRNDGKTLVRRDTGKDALPGPQTYTRCR